MAEKDESNLTPDERKEFIEMRKDLIKMRRELIEALGGAAFFPDVGTLTLADLNQEEEGDN